MTPQVHWPKIAVLSIACLAAGCNIAAPLAQKLAGPPDVQAQYVPAREPMLVFVGHEQ